MFGAYRKGRLYLCIKSVLYTFSTCISLLYNWYWASFPGIKWPGRGVDHPPPSGAEVKETVQLYLFSPSEPTWPVQGLTF